MEINSTMLLQKSDSVQAVQVVAHAFADYAYMEYVAPGVEVRAQVIEWFAAASVQYGMRFGRVEGCPDLSGVAVWLQPGQTHLTPWRLLRSGFMAVPLAVGTTGLLRFIQSSWHMEHEHERYAPGPHWYLLALAVEPGRQRQGIGGRLLQPVMARADCDHVPCYLETHLERNVHLYERYGFQVMSQATMPHSTLTIWAMLRKPGVSQAPL